MTIDPIIPLSWILLIAGGMALLTFIAHLRAAKQLGRIRNTGLTLLRLLGVLAIVALLLRISREETILPRSIEQALLIAVDSSASMAENDVDGISRIDAVRDLLNKSDLLKEENALIRFHEMEAKSA